MKSLPEALSCIYAASGKKFVIIIDEWDVLIRDMAVNQKIQEDYIKLLEETLDMNEKSCNKVRLE